MEKFTTLTGVAAPLNMSNIDTDRILPKLHMRTITRIGLGKALFEDMRFKTDGSELADFVLNREPFRSARIIVAGENFGCGSSREHAPWALLDFGIRCVISTSFADIFYNNCFKNGILPVRVPVNVLKDLMSYAETASSPILTVDLESQEIRLPHGVNYPFEVEPFRRENLLKGLDEISITLQEIDALNHFERELAKREDWLFECPIT